MYRAENTKNSNIIWMTALLNSSVEIPVHNGSDIKLVLQAQHYIEVA
jgi:hypothetical protein